MACLPAELSIGGRVWTVDTDALLGKGGFASVFAARSSQGDRGAAKIVDLRQQSSWATAKLKSEADNLRHAQTHEHIVTFHGEARHGCYHIFLTEVWGKDLLEEVLEHRGLGSERSVHVMAQVMQALTWLHSKRICHGCASAPHRARASAPPPLVFPLAASVGVPEGYIRSPRAVGTGPER